MGPIDLAGKAIADQRLRLNVGITLAYALFADGTICAQRPMQQVSPTIDVTECPRVGDGHDGYLPGLLGVTGAAMAGGRLAILNAGTSQLLFYDVLGKFDRATGGSGSGPGDFSKPRPGDVRSLRLTAYRGDSIIAYDAKQLRATVFGPSGAYARSFVIDNSVRFAGRAEIINGMSQDGDIVLTAKPLSVRPSEPKRGTAIVHDSLLIARVSATGALVWQSPPLEDAVHEVFLSANRTMTGAGPTANVQATMLSRAGTSLSVERLETVGFVNGLIHHYVERLNVIRTFDRKGNLVRTIALPALPAPFRAGSQPERQGLMVLSDDAGRFWLEVPRDWPGAGREWWLISPDGRAISSVRTTTHARPLFVAKGKIGLRSIDQDGTETVSLCTIPPKLGDVRS